MVDTRQDREGVVRTGGYVRVEQQGPGEDQEGARAARGRHEGAGRCEVPVGLVVAGKG